MKILDKKEPILLFLGDILIFTLALWLSLSIRNLGFPSLDEFYNHLTPFSFIFLTWLFSFFIAGLYEKHTVMLKGRLPNIILKTQIFNSIIAALFFYLIPYFGIAPKTMLFIYLFVSFCLILAWRIYGESLFGIKEREKAILIGSGEEMRDLKQEVNNNSRYSLEFVSSIDLDKIDSLDFQSEILDRVYAEDISIIVIDLLNKKVEPMLPHLYNLIFSKIKFVDMHKIYEDIFDRVPLSLLKYNWFLENISFAQKIGYDAFKRGMDIGLSFILGIISVVFYPFAILFIKLDDGGPIFITQERVGQNNKIIKIMKFRSMSVNDDGITEKEKNQKITRAGRFLRKTRIDELPQLWSILKGDMSLVGPRPEMPSLVKLYEKEISYYNIRHLIKPGLSGWAQLYHRTPPKFDTGSKETKTKLSYDLYYIKNHSFLLDLKIALKTLKALLSRSGV
ncbi:MAG: sugar transferase [Parcubacteria group bacterium]|nr:sugar transferase [Parcubacteria group bacterium]